MIRISNTQLELILRRENLREAIRYGEMQLNVALTDQEVLTTLEKIGELQAQLADNAKQWRIMATAGLL